MSDRPPTPFADLNRVLEDLVGGAQRVLGANFAGAYLQGSFAQRDGDAYSDVDFIVVLREDIDMSTVAALNTMHREFYVRPETWAQHLEGSYAPAHTLRRLTFEPRDAPAEPRDPGWRDPQTGMPPRAFPFWFIGNGQQGLGRSEHDNTLVVRWVLRERGIALAGPDPRELVDPVDPGELREEVRTVMLAFAEQLLTGTTKIDALWLQGFTVLMFCRMLQSLATGRVPSKPEAITWAKAQLDPRWSPLIDRAWSERARYPRGPGAPAAHAALLAEPGEVTETLEFVRYVLEVGRTME